MKKVTRAAILSANFGNYDPEIPWVPQSSMFPSPNERLDFIPERFNDENFPDRSLALTPRLKPALIKMFGWEFIPNYDYYLWVDASKALVSPDFGSFMVQQLGKGEFGVFRHPERGTIREEYEFVKQKMASGNRYLLDRYKGEFLEEQYRVIYRDRTYQDDVLYASTGFIYRPLLSVKKALKEWWYHKTRFLLHDQLALPYVLRQFGVKVHVIEENIYKFPLWKHIRKGRRNT